MEGYERAENIYSWDVQVHHCNVVYWGPEWSVKECYGIMSMHTSSLGFLAL